MVKKQNYYSNIRILIFKENLITLNNMCITYFSQYNLIQIESLGNIAEVRFLIYQNEDLDFFPWISIIKTKTEK